MKKKDVNNVGWLIGLAAIVVVGAVAWAYRSNLAGPSEAETQPGGKTVIVYVANTGSDKNTGLTQKTPVRTLQKALDLPVTSLGDNLLIKIMDKRYFIPTTIANGDPDPSFMINRAPVPVTITRLSRSPETSIGWENWPMEHGRLVIENQGIALKISGLIFDGVRLSLGDSSGKSGIAQLRTATLYDNVFTRNPSDTTSTGPFVAVKSVSPNYVVTVSTNVFKMSDGDYKQPALHYGVKVDTLNSLSSAKIVGNLFQYPPKFDSEQSGDIFEGAVIRRSPGYNEGTVSVSDNKFNTYEYVVGQITQNQKGIVLVNTPKRVTVGQNDFSRFAGQQQVSDLWPHGD
jgi:hypothetical protein